MRSFQIIEMINVCYDPLSICLVLSFILAIYFSHYISFFSHLHHRCKLILTLGVNEACGIQVKNSNENHAYSCMQMVVMVQDPTDRNLGYSIDYMSLKSLCMIECNLVFVQSITLEPNF